MPRSLRIACLSAKNTTQFLLIMCYNSAFFGNSLTHCEILVVILMWKFQNKWVIYILNIWLHITLLWMPEDLVDSNSTLIRAMCRYRQATSHHINQCWLRSPTTSGVTRPQWVNNFVLFHYEYRFVTLHTEIHLHWFNHGKYKQHWGVFSGSVIIP